MNQQKKTVWQGERYHKYSKPQYDAAMEALSLLQIAGNERILDIGCGAGSITAEIAKKVPQGSILGTDLSNDMINYAKHAYKNLTNLDFLTLDAQNIPFKNEFDLVVSFFCFHWIADQQMVFCKIAESLKDNGRMLVVSIATSQSPYPLLTAGLHLLAQPKWSLLQSELKQHKFYPQEAQQVEQMLKKAGLKPLQVIKEEKIVYFDSADELENWLSGWIGGLLLTTQLPVEKHTEFIHDLVQAYVELMPKSKDKRISFPLPLLISYTKK